MAETTSTRRDLYEVLGVPRDAKEEQIRSSYKKLALKYHPDKNTDDAEAAAAMFKELAYAHGVLSDPEKRRQYDAAGFEALEGDGLDVELDLSSLGTVNTMFAALFSKLGVPIKTTISISVLEDAMNNKVQIRPLPLGKPISDRVEKQGAHFYSVTLTEEQAKQGLAVRAISNTQSKFKILYFEKDATGSLQLALQDDSIKAFKVTVASFFFLRFQVFRIDPTVNALAVAKDPEAALFKKLDGLQPCEVSSLEAGEHVFAVYGDNFFKSASYTIEAFVVPENDTDLKDSLREVETEILSKRDELRAFETEFRDIQARFQALSAKYKTERDEVDKLLVKRDKIHEMFSSGAKPGKAAAVPAGSVKAAVDKSGGSVKSTAAATKGDDGSGGGEREGKEGAVEEPSVPGSEQAAGDSDGSVKKKKWGFGFGSNSKSQTLGLF